MQSQLSSTGIRSYRYKAFISYSHAADSSLAPALQAGLHRFARPMFKLRALRIFRDATNLSASPGLWSSIKEALALSEYFVLLASPEAADSPWVQKEVDFWLKERKSKNIFIVITDGTLKWQPSQRDFDWESTTALPDNLKGVFTEEPLFLDLSWANSREQLTLRNPKFRNIVADLAAPMHGRNKDEIIGEDVSQQHRRNRMILVVIVSIIILAGIAIWQAIVAIDERERALNSVRVSVAWEYIEKDTDVSVNLLREVDAPDHIRGWRGAVGKLRSELGIADGFNLEFNKDFTSGKFSPDGQRVLSSSIDSTASLWDVLSGRQITVFRHEEAVTATSFSPDGRFVVTGSVDGTASVWDAYTGVLNHRLKGHADGITSIGISPDGKYLATASYDNTARMWDLVSGQVLFKFLGHTGWVTFTSFSPDGKFVVTASIDGTFNIWEVSSGNQLATYMHDSRITDITFSPDGSRFVSVSLDGKIKLWSVMTGEIDATFTGSDAVNSAAFSPDASKLVCSFDDNTAKIWDLFNPDLGPVVLTGHTGPVFSSVFSPNGNSIVTASLDGTARLWKLDGLVDSVFEVDGGGLKGADYSPDGSKVLIVNLQGNAKILNILMPIEILTIWLNEQNTDCLIPSYRTYLLGQSEKRAGRDYKACIENRN